MGQPELDIEKQRIRELSKYYCTFDQQDVLHANPDPEQIESASQKTTRRIRLSADTTLTALTQLGVYRFGCNRSFVSIIDGEQQHVIAEATASISLRNKDKHQPNDGIFLGATTLDLEWGVCPHVIRLFTGQDTSLVQNTENITADQTRNIIRDFTKEDFYKNRPYVLGWPFFRFYAEVPLYSPSGHVLGSYCVVDDKPRAEFSEEDMAALREIADSITNHLENARIVQFHRRSEKLVKGLTGFVKSHSKFDPTGSSTQGQIEAFTKKLSLEDSDLPIDQRGMDGILDFSSTRMDTGTSASVSEAAPDSVSGHEASIFSQNLCSRSASTLPSSLSRASSSRADTVPSYTESSTELAAPETVPLTERVAAMFSRASVLLKESLDLDGVIFFDAHRNDPQFESPGNKDEWDALSKIDETSSPLSSSSSSGGPVSNSSNDAEQYCGFLGQALSCGPANSNTGSDHQVKLTEDLLHSLITHFPEGQIFNVDSKTQPDNLADFANEDSETPSPSLEIYQQICQHLAQQLPLAKCVLFYPLWDWNKSRWLAGTFVWVNGIKRHLGMEDLHYFKAFGDSIISEVSRVQWIASENSKFDFVTSISHELRSPLHGILASAELLLDIPLQPAHRDMVNMISTSGLTLLDTIDHLLDYCKINNLTATQSLNTTRGENAATSLVSDFNLDALVEEVAVILHTGRNWSDPVSSLASEIATAHVSSQANYQHTGTADELSVVVSIDQSSSWRIRSVAGAWKRIVMNLLGNSMKWTQAGLIEISLSQAIVPAYADKHLIHLRVTDTGQGIGTDFLENSAFSPFAQENALSEGVGLGLSVVHKLVKFLGGDIKIKSDNGVGTQVDVYIPAPHPKELGTVSPAGSTTPIGRKSPESSMKACLIGFNGYPDLTETPTGILSSDAKRKLSIQKTLASVFKTRMGWQVVLAESLEKGEGHIAVIEQGKFEALLAAQTSSAPNCGHQFKLFIVLGSTTPSPGCSLPPNAILVPQPYGPRKICEAAERIMEMHESLSHIGAPQATTLPIITISQEPIRSEPTPQILPVLTKNSSEESTVELVCPPPLLAATPSGTNSDLEDMHVLIVDDNDINLKILATFMQKLGCSYETASNGLIALEQVQSSSRRYDLIFMDLSMPVMDGLVSTSKIRQHEKDQGLRPSRIMAVTGVASETMQQAAVTAGIDDYLVKPLSLRKLKKLMETSF
ncbi:hypothetical protein N7535_008595 [Penicillium sp. DV-2018c]|nr:hypothetical protein N7535_008595 [Penicillium sp. DV-2018c]